MEAKLSTRKGATKYYVRLSWYDAFGKRHQTEVSTGIPIENGNKRKAKLKMEEIKEEYRQKYEVCKLLYTNEILFSDFMATWLEKGRGMNICDVACGTGNLILTYLDLIGKEEAVALIRNGCLYLYDSDDVALRICEVILLLKYGKELKPFIHFIQGDFLSKQVCMPENCKVISNPLYATVSSINKDWEDTAVAL